MNMTANFLKRTFDNVILYVHFIPMRRRNHSLSL